MWIRGVGVIRIGDSNVLGGKVISGSSTGSSGGRAFALLNDLVDCPGKYSDGQPHGINKIVTGSTYFTYQDIPVALDGDISECGCALITSYGLAPELREKPSNPASDRFSSTAPWIRKADIEQQEAASRGFDEQIRLVGSLPENYPYLIETIDGYVQSGRIDSSGHLPRIRTDTLEHYSVYWGDEALAKQFDV